MNSKRIAALVLALALVLLLAACGGGLSGTYVSQDLIPQTFTFNGDQVTMSAFGVSTTGTYSIDGNQIVIRYSMFGQDLTWSQSFSRSGKSIYIGGTEFRKR